MDLFLVEGASNSLAQLSLQALGFGFNPKPSTVNPKPPTLNPDLRSALNVFGLGLRVLSQWVWLNLFQDIGLGFGFKGSEFGGLGV